MRPVSCPVEAGLDRSKPVWSGIARAVPGLSPGTGVHVPGQTCLGTAPPSPGIVPGHMHVLAGLDARAARRHVLPAGARNRAIHPLKPLFGPVGQIYGRSVPGPVRQREAKRRCATCRAPLPPGRVGRPSIYCTSACRQRAYRRRRDGEQKRGLVQLVQMDARELLPSLPGESVDLVVTDPPYHFDRGSSRFRNLDFPLLPDSEWPAIFAELHRVLAADAHAYVLADYRTQPVFEEAARAAGFRVRTPLVWDKCSPGLGGLYRAQYELVGVYEKGSRPGNFRNRSNVIRAPRVARGYPTEKPVRLLRPLISQSSRRGELVLDPFCGSGSMGRAARELGRRALLCDIDVRVARHRLRLSGARLPGARIWQLAPPFA